jgi:GT2 family glycosyltransferase
MAAKERVLVAIPSYGALMSNETGVAVADLVSQRQDVEVVTISASLLCLNRNQLWCHALNRRGGKNPISHFLFLDADVAPVPRYWFEILLGVMRRYETQVLGAVVPIKNGSGLTSTARESDDPWHPTPVALAELRNHPDAWTEPGLLVSTGLLLVDFRQPWVERICFTIRDRVVKTPNGFAAEAAPEDWDFSRQARALGATIWATTAVPLKHWGPAWWSSHS